MSWCGERDAVGKAAPRRVKWERLGKGPFRFFRKRHLTDAAEKTKLISAEVKTGAYQRFLKSGGNNDVAYLQTRNCGGARFRILKSKNEFI